MSDDTVHAVAHAVIVIWLLALTAEVIYR